MGKESKKTESKSKKTSSKTAKKTAGLVKHATPSTSAPAENTYSLERAASVLGEVEPLLEQALRASHPDEALRSEGVKVASERILADGERLCSDALALLESKDKDVRQALDGAGLSRGWLALTVDALLRLKGQASQGKDHRQSSARQKATTGASLESALAEGRKNRRLALERLALVVKGRPELETSFQQNRQTPTSTEALTSQLDGIAAMIDSILQPADPMLRALALARQFSAAEAEALRQGAKEIREARDIKGPAGAARQKEHQAILDVLDGLCLLLLREVFRALGTAAELTPKVRRPTLYTLRTYYVRAGVIEADDEAPPVA